MKTKLIIPKTISVGFQNRSDTYTGKLAYVIYTDNKGVLRKETSWNSWRDQKIETKQFENTPTSGFVLNKKVGDHGGGWDSRKAWIRVWDPRNFEFEISVANLLFILEETNSIKGKGLDGDFVYSWDKADLVLLPANSKEYKSSSEFTGLQSQKVAQKDMQEGFIYINKDNEQVLYLGREDWFQLSTKYHDGSVIKTLEGSKKHVFVKINQKTKKAPKPIEQNEDLDDDLDDELEENIEDNYWIQTGFTKIAKKLSEEPSPLFASEFEKFKKSQHGSKPIGIKVKPAKYNFKEYWNNRELYIRANDQIYVTNMYGYGGARDISVSRSTIPIEETPDNRVVLHRQFPEQRYPYRNTLYTKEEIENLDLVHLFIENEQGVLTQI